MHEATVLLDGDPASLFGSCYSPLLRASPSPGRLQNNCPSSNWEGHTPGQFGEIVADPLGSNHCDQWALPPGLALFRTESMPLLFDGSIAGKDTGAQQSSTHSGSKKSVSPVLPGQSGGIVELGHVDDSCMVHCLADDAEDAAAQQPMRPSISQFRQCSSTADVKQPIPADRRTLMISEEVVHLDITASFHLEETGLVATRLGNMYANRTRQRRVSKFLRNRRSRQRVESPDEAALRDRRKQIAMNRSRQRGRFIKSGANS
jgi:hypothetical protein